MEGNAPPSWRYQHPALLLSYIALASSSGLEPKLRAPKTLVLPITPRGNIIMNYIEVSSFHNILKFYHKIIPNNKN